MRPAWSSDERWRTEGTEACDEADPTSWESPSTPGVGSRRGTSWKPEEESARMRTVGILAADGFQDSELFLPKIAIEKLGIETQIISLSRDPIEIYSFFSKIGLLIVQKAIEEADPADYIGILVPGGAKSPAILAESETVLAFLRRINGDQKLVAPICRGTLLVATADIVKHRRITGFHQAEAYPDLVVRPIVEKFGGMWREDQPVVVDGNLISSRHPDDMPQFVGAIRDWLAARSEPIGPRHEIDPGFEIASE